MFNKPVFVASKRVSVVGELLSVELVSDSLTQSMIAEFGIVKTCAAIQALYDADVLTEAEANAMLDSVNNIMLHDFARYGCYGDKDQFSPVVLH